MKIYTHISTLIKPLFLFFVLTAFASIAQTPHKIDSLHKSFDKIVFNDLKTTTANAKEAVRLSEALKDDSSLLKSYLNLSKAYYLSGFYDKAKVSAEKGLSIAIKLNDYQTIGVFRNRLGSINRRQNLYLNSLTYHQEALSIAEEYKLKHLEGEVFNGLAHLSRAKGEDSLAFSQLDNAITIAKSNKYNEILAGSYNLKGILYYDRNKDSASLYFTKALELYRIAGDEYHQGLELANLGDLYIPWGKYDKGLSYLVEAEAIFEEVGATNRLHNINMSLGTYYEHQDDMASAIAKYEKGLNTYGEFADGFQIKHDYWLLSGVYYHEGNFEKALDYLEKYTVLSDSLFSIQKEKQFDEIRTIYEVEKKDTAIKVLENEKELVKAKQKWIIASALVLLLPLVFLFVFYLHRAKTQSKIRQQEKEIHSKEKQRLQKEQELAEIKALIDGQDKERNRIAKELHDGIGGQLASVNLSLSHINGSLEDEKISVIGDNLKGTLKELRLLSHNLSTNAYKDKDFEVLLGDLKKQYENPKQFDVEVSVFPQDCFKNMDDNIKHNLYRILQESLANISKHAQAKFVSLSFTRHHENLIVVIEDDGVGFDMNKTKAGIGIKNIEERLKTINGSIEMDTCLNEGTNIILDIPIDNSKEDE